MPISSINNVRLCDSVFAGGDPLSHSIESDLSGNVHRRDYQHIPQEQLNPEQAIFAQQQQHQNFQVFEENRHNFASTINRDPGRGDWQRSAARELQNVAARCRQLPTSSQIPMYGNGERERRLSFHSPVGYYDCTTPTTPCYDAFSPCNAECNGSITFGGNCTPRNFEGHNDIIDTNRHTRVRSCSTDYNTTRDCYTHSKGPMDSGFNGPYLQHCYAQDNSHNVPVSSSTEPPPLSHFPVPLSSYVSMGNNGNRNDNNNTIKPISTYPSPKYRQFPNTADNNDYVQDPSSNQAEQQGNITSSTPHLVRSSSALPSNGPEFRVPQPWSGEYEEYTDVSYVIT